MANSKIINVYTFNECIFLYVLFILYIFYLFTYCWGQHSLTSLSPFLRYHISRCPIGLPHHCCGRWCHGCRYHPHGHSRWPLRCLQHTSIWARIASACHKCHRCCRSSSSVESRRTFEQSSKCNWWYSVTKKTGRGFQDI